MELTTAESKEYRLIGDVDTSQNWLELFTPKLINKLAKNLTNSELTYSEKADKVEELLKHRGFEFIGIGTNIITMGSPSYQGVVFKIALDGGGIQDNINDERLSSNIKEYAEFLTRDITGVVSVQKRYVVMTEERVGDYYGKIIKLLTKLSSEYLLADVSPVTFRNYGIGRNGELVIIDGSDMIPLSEVSVDISCAKEVYKKHGRSNKSKPCGGELVYDKEFKFLTCTKCGKSDINPLLYRPRKELKDMSIRDGLTIDQKERMYLEECHKVHGVEISPAGDIDEPEGTDEDTTTTTPSYGGGVGAPIINACLNFEADVEEKSMDGNIDGVGSDDIRYDDLSDTTDEAEVYEDSDHLDMGVEVARRVADMNVEDQPLSEIRRDQYGVKVTTCDNDDYEDIIITIDDDMDEFCEEDMPCIKLRYGDTELTISSHSEILALVKEIISDNQ